MAKKERDAVAKNYHSQMRDQSKERISNRKLEREIVRVIGK